MAPTRGGRGRTGRAAECGTRKTAASKETGKWRPPNPVPGGEEGGRGRGAAEGGGVSERRGMGG